MTTQKQVKKTLISVLKITPKLVEALKTANTSLGRKAEREDSDELRENHSTLSDFIKTVDC